MLLGNVIGNVVATIKHESMQGCKLMIIQPEKSDGKSPDGDPVVAVDCVGAGVGEKVIITSDGKAAREFLNVQATPVRWTIVGIKDS